VGVVRLIRVICVIWIVRAIRTTSLALNRTSYRNRRLILANTAHLKRGSETRRYCRLDVLSGTGSVIV
jgi:hypothetical protein